MTTITLRAPDGSAATFTFEGAAIGTDTPAGAALALLAAQFEQKREECLRLLCASSRAMVPPDTTPMAPFFGNVAFQVHDVALDGDRATVRMSMLSELTGDQPLPNNMACVREGRAWCVDLMATMSLAMSAMQSALDAGKEGIGALGTAVEDLGKLLNDLGGKLPGTDGEESGATQ